MFYNPFIEPLSSHVLSTSEKLLTSYAPPAAVIDQNHQNPYHCACIALYWPQYTAKFQNFGVLMVYSPTLVYFSPDFLFAMIRFLNIMKQSVQRDHPHMPNEKEWWHMNSCQSSTQPLSATQDLSSVPVKASARSPALFRWTSRPKMEKGASANEFCMNDDRRRLEVNADNHLQTSTNIETANIKHQQTTCEIAWPCFWGTHTLQTLCDHILRCITENSSQELLKGHVCLFATLRRIAFHNARLKKMSKSCNYIPATSPFFTLDFSINLATM